MMLRRLRLTLALVLACAGTVRATEAWRDATFAKRVKVSFDNTNIDGDEVDFPALLNVDGTSEARGQIASADITEGKWVIYDGDGNKLAWEQESYTDDGGAGYAVFNIWVKTDIYTAPAGDQNAAWFYYDNSATSANTATDVWSANFVCVLHMQGANAAACTDSSGTGNPVASDNGTVTYQQTGKIAYATNLGGGADDRMVVSDAVSIRFDSGSQDYTLALWKKHDSTANDYFIDKRDGENDGWSLVQISSAAWSQLDHIDVKGANIIGDTSWHHIAAPMDRDGNGQVYLDGAASGAPVALSSEAMATTHDMWIGDSPVFNAPFDGTLDEIRLSSALRSADWIKFEHANINEADRELVWSAAETQPAAGNVPAAWMHFYKTRNR